MLKLIIRIGLICTVLLFILHFTINYLFAHKLNNQQLHIEFGRSWIHRGLYDNKIVYENTIAALDSASQYSTIHGIELDIFYIDSLYDFVVTHDMPNKFGLPILKLSDVLQRYQGKWNYWLDLKNLTDDNKIDINKAMKQCCEKANFANLNLLYIESGEADALGYLASKKWNTLYWIQFNRTEAWRQYLKVMKIKTDFIYYNYSAASIGETFFDEVYQDYFHQMPSFVFHIYDRASYNRVHSHANANVYLMDYIPNSK
jgi:glycerophosphoryl diester phosphodiesterase